ncbi:MAG: aminoacyl-tRNA hydrolase [Deltaproteobacteria bacterium]|nr:aminoacyl-tRNA hydrolase [Deltaproteobacteria bacterium]
MYLVAGLGNPGRRYLNTRHNVGFMVVRSIAASLGVSLNGRRFQSRNARTRFHDKDTILLCPYTYMNRSGIAVKTCTDYYRIDSGNLLVVHDDLDLDVGRIRVYRNGGAGGHKGVLSIMDHLGTNAFSRVRIGIGRPRFGESVEEYVLSRFSGDERDTIEKVVHMAVAACGLCVSEGVERAMNYVNRQNLTDKEVHHTCRD